MAQLTQRGLIDSIGAIESRQYKDKTFVSRTFIIEQPRFDSYTGEKLGSNFIKFEATKDDTCAMLDKFAVGAKVEVEFIVRGTKYAKKDGSGDDVFTHLELRNIGPVGQAVEAKASATASPIPTAAPAPIAQPAPAAESASGDYDESLGF